MAQNDYYTLNKGSVNGDVHVSVQVFDEITKRTVADMKDVSLDPSKGWQIPGTKALVGCSIENGEVIINIHIRLKYGVNIAKKTMEIQEKIATAIKDMTGVKVTHINIEVDDIDFK